MWVIDLNCKQDSEQSEAKNVLTLLAGLSDIKVSDIIVNEKESSDFVKADGLLAFNKRCEAKFMSSQDIDVCRKKYFDLSNRRKTTKTRRDDSSATH